MNEEDGNESKENQNGESAGTENQVEKSAGAEGNEQNEAAEEVSKEKAPAKAEDGKRDYVIGGKHMRLTRKDAKRERKIAKLKDVDPDTIRNALVNLAQKAWEKSDEKIEPVIFAASEKLRETSKKLIGSEIRIVSVTKDSLEHIRNNHSQNEKLRGQKNLTPSDAADIYDTVNDFSSATLERTDKLGHESMLVVKGKNNRTFVLLVKKRRCIS